VKLDIHLVVPGMAFNGQTFASQSLGGSESAGYYMARALARKGHNVTVFCNLTQGTGSGRWDDVDYLPIDIARQWMQFNRHDVTIIQRAPEFFTGKINSCFSALWCHDLASVRSEAGPKGTAWNYDKQFLLSKFHVDQYREVLGMPDEIMFQTRNGVDLELVEQVRNMIPSHVHRNPLSLVFTARPERGLDILLAHIMPRILKEEPQTKLWLATYDNKVEHLAQFYSHCKALGDNLGAGVVNYLGHLNKAKLYEVMHVAGLYVYPVPSQLLKDFDEISCISVMEAQACGLPVVCSGRGALPETLGPGAGTLVNEPIHTPEYYDAFAKACLHYMRNAKARKEAGQAGLAHAKTLDWSGVADQWLELFEKEIRQKSADLATLANHFYRRSDIYAARECLNRLPEDDQKSAYVRKQLREHWGFLDETDGFREQYERIGGTHDEAVIDWSPREPRYAALRDWIRQNFPQLPDGDVTNILDYGCAHGGYATNLLKEIPNIRITGVDIDMHGIMIGDKFAEKLGVSDRWLGVVGDYNRLSDKTVPEFRDRQYDVALAQEVLEHVPDPGAVLQALEERVKDGGIVYITIPYGPWEYTDYKRYPYRAHVREFDLHDIHDLLDAKDAKEAQISVRSMPFGFETYTEEPLGWWIVQYRVTPKTRGLIGRLNMERKLWLQAPRQTVSAVIMAGGSSVEETWLWSLRSMEHFIDELVVVDCGLSATALNMLEASPFNDGRIKLIQGEKGPDGQPLDPKIHGFETPRNVGLRHATQDWVLWLDTDEKVLQPEKIHKWLRSSIFQGYSIHQHHPAVDTSFPPDLPVRLFRNNGKLRFFGMIHEHPETALNAGPGLTMVIPDVHIFHLGYPIETGRKLRFQRNLPMLEADKKKYPDRKLQKHFIMRDNMLLVMQGLQMNGMMLTDELAKLCEEVIQVYREHFLGKGTYSNTDPIIYYSQAVGLLAARDNRGFDLNFSITADKVNAADGGHMKVRFASVEDAQAEMAYRLKAATERYTRRYF
jgi:glycosyltransferase involved in cell wall biosynthesis/2-polyprenyl-3-methyl-5-hydroxy-6-metoxy-1,4-benzoquinol methylase